MNILKDDTYYINPQTGSIDLGMNWECDFNARDTDLEPTWESWGGDCLEELDYSDMCFDDLCCLLPKECKSECSCSGENYCACSEWVEILNLQQSRESCIKIIKEDGMKDYENDSDHDLRIKFLWLAAGMNDE